MRRPGLLLGLLTLVVGAGCGGASANPGLLALLRVDGGQFVPGTPPADAGGPAVTGLVLPRTTVRPGEADFVVSGAAARGTRAVLLSLAGDVGYWVLPAGVPDLTAPEEPTYEASLSFAPTLPGGERELGVQAVDREGRPGAPRRERLSVAETPLPDGRLVISLRWDTEADLDLHVVEPSGVEIWARKPSGEPLPGDGGTATAGTLDVDSNAGCVIDGRRVENVIYPAAPPPGDYVVRVDTWSLCGATHAYWVVEVRLDGRRVGRASGLSDQASTRGPHGRGAGILALGFRVP